MFRCYLKTCPKYGSKPVLIQHGLQLSSDFYVMNPGKESLGTLKFVGIINWNWFYFFYIEAFFLADQCSDIWLTNSRGNRYSRKHITKDPDDAASGFWNFTWTEMGKFDLPASIDYILSETSHSKVRYIGHSEGTTMLLALLSLRPEYNQKISIANLMAPIAFENNAAIEAKVVFDLFLELWVNTTIFHHLNDAQNHKITLMINALFVKLLFEWTFFISEFFQFQPLKDTELTPTLTYHEEITKDLCPAQYCLDCGSDQSEKQRNRVRWTNLKSFKFPIYDFISVVDGVGVSMSIIWSINEWSLSFQPNDKISLFRSIHA